MSGTTHNSATRRGISYLCVLGVIGLTIAIYLAIKGFIQLLAERFQTGFVSLIVGVFLAAAAIRVLKLWRGMRVTAKRSQGQ